MKRILTMALTVLTSMVLYSCGEDSREPEECEVPILFQVNPNSLLFGSDDQDAQAIFVAAMNVTWRAEVEASAQDWLKITVEQDKISVRVEENKAKQDRTGKITVIPENETLNPVAVTVTQTLTETLYLSMEVGTFLFFADYYESGLANYSLSLAGKDAEYDEVSSGIFVHEGYAVFLELLADDITNQDYQSTEARTGNYSESMDPEDEDFVFEKWSFLKTIRENYDGITYFSGSRLMYFSNSICTDNISLTGGSVVVEGESGDYHIVADLMTDRRQRIVVEYSGPFDEIANDVSESTYTTDREINGLSQGTLEFHGEDGQFAPGTYYWGATLLTPEPNNGAKFVLCLYSPKTDPVAMDTGVYTFQTESPYEAYTVEAGYASYWGNHYGTWIYEYDDAGVLSDFTPLVEGTITVKHNTENNYSITIDAFMDNYYKLNASFEGDLEYVDKSSASAGFKGTPYQLENRGMPDAKIPERNKRSPRYGLKKID